MTNSTEISPNDEGRLSLKIELTAEQRKSIESFIEKTGSKRLESEVIFVVDKGSGSIATSTFMVGNAV